ncbi:MAG: hypothetical protein QOH03_1004, partial [Kribbellaceae bacterium]|nr:hypothetical protein [Kribbellaceae bacterium]
LERAGDRTTVGPPPIDAMRAGATRRKRRRPAVISFAAAVSVVAAVGGTAMLVAPGGASQKVPAATKGTNLPPSVSSSSPTNGVEAGIRLVGLGHVGITVPQSWGTNQARCGTPTSDTVLINEWFVQLCAIDRPAGVESVEVGDGEPGPVYRYGFKPDVRFEIDGVPAQRQRTTCEAGKPAGPLDCAGIVFLPSTGVWFRAESSTSAAEVDRILDRIVVLPSRVGVPEYAGSLSKDDGSSGQKYAGKLRALGLRVETVTAKSPNYTPGDLLKVEPFPGTMLPQGATVTITVVAKR